MQFREESVVGHWIPSDLENVTLDRGLVNQQVENRRLSVQDQDWTIQGDIKAMRIIKIEVEGEFFTKDRVEEDVSLSVVDDHLPKKMYIRMKKEPAPT
jgi:hypothetical protein